MTHRVLRRRAYFAACFGALAALAVLTPVAPAVAQEKKAAAPAKDDGKKKSQWVKLCDKIQINARAEKGKEKEAPAPQQKELCSTMFEAIESNSGQIIVSVGLQQMEGAPKEVLAVMVPLGVVIPSGVKLAVYNADQWKKAAANETVELKELKTTDLRFAHCLPVGCTAETEATKEIVDSLKKGAGLAVLALWANGNQFTVPVPLTGFDAALNGKPVDNKEYQANRKKLMQAIRQRQIDAMNKRKAEEMKNLPPPPGNAANGAAAKKK